jgi:hypothetical protein
MLYHGKLLSIARQAELGLVVPQRESRDDDIRRNGVGDAVKISILPYWRMLGTLLRRGNPEVLLELTTDPILWNGVARYT